MYLELLKNCLLDNIYGSHHHDDRIAHETEVENGTYWPKRAHTMIGMKRLNNIQQCFETVVKNNIPGDMIETGVWRGGCTIFMAALNKYYGQQRKVFVADSFEGLPPPDPKYAVDNGDTLHTYDFLRVSLGQVKENFSKYGLLEENVVFIKGFFEHSLKNAPIEKISILRLDGDMYSSTIQVLEQLYDKDSEGGYIIIDDYALNGCKIAVDDFRRLRNITSELHEVDWTGRYWVK
jgi:hypothetical protein